MPSSQGESGSLNEVLCQERMLQPGCERSSHECLALFEMDITPKFSGNEQSVVSEAAEVTDYEAAPYGAGTAESG